MTTNGDHDDDLTVPESAGSRIRRLANIQRLFVRNLDEAAERVDSLAGAARAEAIEEIAHSAGELGDSYHDLRRALAKL